MTLEQFVQHHEDNIYNIGWWYGFKVGLVVGIVVGMAALVCLA